MNEYTLVRDEDGWGVMWNDALINAEPMTKQAAKELANECNRPDSGGEYQAGYAYACGYYD